jgi:hypothetical protein
MKRIALLVWTLAALNVSANGIVLNEVMYHASGSDLEFVELYNASGASVSLAGWKLLDDSDAHAPCLLSGTIPAGGYFVVASDAALFASVHPGVSPVNAAGFNAGGTGWALGNGSDEVRLFDAAGALRDAVAYSDGGDWPGSPDGDGPSLELLNPGLDNSLPASWDPSLAAGGTPGRVNSVYTSDAPPVCRDGSRLVEWPVHGGPVAVTVFASDAEGPVTVRLMIDTGAGFAALSMNDAGTNGDAVAADSIFTGVIPAQPAGTLVRYYAAAVDGAGQTDVWPGSAPDEVRAYTVDYAPPKLRITELMAANRGSVRDAFGDADDWFEIKNEGSVTVDLGGLFVTSDLGSPRKFRLPARTLAPGATLLVWADDEADEGTLHANFKLSASGEEIGLFETENHGNGLIHGWKYGRLGEDQSMGFLTDDDAASPEYLSPATPGADNAAASFYSAVCINEFQCTSDFGGPDDWVEIYNRGSAVYDLSGCFLSDERSNHTKWAFPQGTLLEPGDYRVVWEDALGFGFASEGDDVIQLTFSDSTTGLDFFDFGPQTADHSNGRLPDGAPTWAFFSKPTRGSENVTAAVPGDGGTVLPGSIALFPNRPNPFNPETVLSFTVASRRRVTLSVVDETGRRAAVLADRVFDPGRHDVTWRPAGLPSGVYVAVLETGGARLTGKMLLLR